MPRNEFKSFVSPNMHGAVGPAMYHKLHARVIAIPPETGIESYLLRKVDTHAKQRLVEVASGQGERKNQRNATAATAKSHLATADQ